MAKRARLNVEIDGDSKGLKRALDNAERRAKKFGSVMKGAMKKAGMVAGAAGAVGLTIFTRELGKAAEYYDKIGKAATRFKISTTTLQKLAPAAAKADTSLESVGRGMTRLIKSTREAQLNKKGSMAQAFKDLNIQLADLSQKAPDERLFMVAKAFREAEDRQRAFAALLQVMGRSADELIPLFEEMNEFNHKGRILKEADIRAIEKFNDAIFDFKLEVTALAGEVIPKLVEGFKTAKTVLGNIARLKIVDDIKWALGMDKKGKPEAPMMAPKVVQGFRATGNFPGLDRMVDMQRRRAGDMRFARGGKFKAQRHFFNEIDPVFGSGSFDPTAAFQEPLDIFKNSGPLVTGPGGPLEGAGMPVHPNSKLGRAIRAGKKPPGTRRRGVQSAAGTMGAVGGLSGPTAFKSIRDAEAKKQQEESEKRMSPQELLEDIADSSRTTADNTTAEY